MIISENVGCNGEAVEDGVNGAVFRFSDKDPIAGAIRRIREPAFYNKISQNIRKTDFGKLRGARLIATWRNCITIYCSELSAMAFLLAIKSKK